MVGRLKKSIGGFGFRILSGRINGMPFVAVRRRAPIRGWPISSFSPASSNVTTALALEWQFHVLVSVGENLNDFKHRVPFRN
jgi:hypothetical protein